jgi:hypothetical protein
MRRGARNLTAWLVLAVCLLASVAPAQALVLCFEPDGRAVLETASNDGCEGCPGTGEAPLAVVEDGVDAGSCACIDIPLPRSSDEPEARLKSGEPRPPCALFLPPLAVVAASLAEPPPALALAPRAPPRQAPGLLSIRTVILRV